MSAAAPRFCAACGGSLARAAQFCGACGKPQETALRRVHDAGRAEAARVRAGATVLAIGVGGLIATLVVQGSLPPLPAAVESGVQHGCTLLVTAAAMDRLGRGWRGWRAAAGRAPRVADLGLAVAIAAATFAFAWLWVALAIAPLFEHGDGPPAADRTWRVVDTVLFAPVLEEWLCRGVMWVAIRPLFGRTTTIVSLAACFALWHGLNGLHLLELPHRFVMGVLLGWLRDRTGSVVPCVAAHALHNGAAALLTG